jgi:cysteine desulfurase
VRYLSVDGLGMINLDDLENSITKSTSLVSIMYANNEVGTVQPIHEIAKICQENSVLFHSDAVQAAGKIPIDVNELGIDLMSISSHKINGPKGVGALYVKRGTRLAPFVLGGGQEGGMRSGTENVASIVGFGKACQIAKEGLAENSTHMKSLCDRLIEKVTGQISHVTVNGHRQNRLPNNAHFTFLGVNGEDLIIKLDEHGIAASTGSACSVKTQKASHVLAAMGFSHEQITGSLRLTVGLGNTEDEIDKTVDALKKIVVELRAVSPFKAKYGF